MNNKKNPVTSIFNLKNKTVVLTGSSGRLGTQYADILSAAGANVILADIESKKNKKLENNLKKKYDVSPLAYSVDISQNSEVEIMTDVILEKYKKIDVLINNAFFNPSQSKFSSSAFEKFPLELWNQVLSVNLTGPLICSQSIGRIMEKQKKGVIVNISSIYGLVGADQRIYGKSNLNSPVSYAATKGGIVSLTRYLAAYWHGKNIRVNTLSLGGVLDKTYMKNDFIKKYSEKTILGRMANKDEYKGALLFLASDASSYMTGANLVIDGGWTAW
ncbi:SDR family oxidoreductase [Nitrosopumilus sp. b2]|uniref:SDR family oxidoreductase n=1 Tax=Nitrosopumilus sp. b2 TaxID=2109908 RepID=UPI001C714360|nr:SDR family oxidoreductase [Nitrosopumilus sp. b2]